MDTPPPRLLDQVRAVLRRKHYSLRTEEAYVGWIKRFVLFHGKRHPTELGLPHVEAFLTHLPTRAAVSVWPGTIVALIRSCYTTITAPTLPIVYTTHCRVAYPNAPALRQELALAVSAPPGPALIEPVQAVAPVSVANSVSGIVQPMRSAAPGPTAILPTPARSAVTDVNDIIARPQAQCVHARADVPRARADYRGAADRVGHPAAW
jgi:hypothetical protein